VEVDGVLRRLILGLGLREKIGRQVVEAQHRFELDLCLGVPSEREVGVPEGEVRGDVIGSSREAALEENERFLRARGAKRSAAEQIVKAIVSALLRRTTGSTTIPENHQKGVDPCLRSTKPGP
jgi:hypothetical protein